MRHNLRMPLAGPVNGRFRPGGHRPKQLEGSDSLGQASALSEVIGLGLDAGMITVSLIAASNTKTWLNAVSWVVFGAAVLGTLNDVAALAGE